MRFFSVKEERSELPPFYIPYGYACAAKNDVRYLGVNAS